MIISKKHKFIFIHVPKCAGTTISAAIHKFYFDSKPTRNISGEEWIIGKNDKSLHNSSEGWVAQHTTFRVLKEKFDEDLSEYYKFAFVRNPFERAVSYWKYQYKYFKSFKYFLRKRMKCGKGDLQSVRLSDEEGGMHMNFVGKVERIQSDFDEICDKIGMDRVNLPFRNQTEHKHYTEYYDEECIKMVSKKFQKDIDMFGYKFGD